MIVLMMRGYGDRIRSYREVVELYNATYPDQCDPISKSTVERTIARFQRTLIKDEPRSGRPKSTTNDDKVADVLNDNSFISVSRVQEKKNDISVSSSNFEEALLSSLQNASPAAIRRRLWQKSGILRHNDDKFDDNNQFFNWICFSDEATFELNGSINWQDVKYWADENLNERKLHAEN